MELIQNVKKDENGFSGEVLFSLFNKYIELGFSDSIPLDYVNRCSENLNSLSEKTIADLCFYLTTFCQDYMSYVPDVKYSKGLYNISSPREILSFIDPLSLQIDSPDNWDTTALNLYCKCAWDQDNDLQILINDNHVIYVGGYNGLNCWQKNLSKWGNYVSGYKLCE